jgi:hypothetical protein
MVESSGTIAAPDNDSTDLIQRVWEDLQVAKPLIKSENNVQGRFRWSRFIRGNPATGVNFYILFMQLFNLTKHAAAQEIDGDKSGADLVDRIKKWDTRVIYDNAFPKTQDHDTRLIDEGVRLCEEYEDILIKRNIVRPIRGGRK